MSIDDTYEPQWLSLDGLVNARVVVPGVLLRSDNLQSLSDADVQQLLEEQELEVVLDLRTEFELESEGPGPLTAVPSVRIEHHSLYPDRSPDPDGGDGSFAHATRPADSPYKEDLPGETATVRAYLSYLDLRPDSLLASIRAIARADGSVLVHCAAGKDRTGVVVGLALDAADVDRATIVADYAASAERIDAILARLVASPTYHDEMSGAKPRSQAPVPETMERLLEIVDARYGGSAAWLSSEGFSDEDLEALRRRLAPARVT
jgi:rhodanese-related sulfurtransferase